MKLFGLPVFYSIALPSHLSFDPTNPPVNVSIIPEKEFQIGQHVNHSYYVINSGPTSVSELELVVSWPWKIKNGSYLLYITMMKVPLELLHVLNWVQLCLCCTVFRVSSVSD